MAVRISCASGDFTAAGTWATADATSLLDSEAANTALTTSYVESSAFTPGAITIDGIAVKVALRAAGSPATTMTVRLAQGGADVAGTVVTINVSDLLTNSSASLGNLNGWHLFKFSSPVTLAAATAYTVSAKLSATTVAVNLFRNATAGNWSRMLRTTTTAAPGAGDTLHVMGEHTGAGTGNNIVVDMDSTASTDYGPGTDGSPALTVGKRGTLQYKYAASTNYYLKLSGDLVVYGGGTFTIGTVANPIPRTSTAVLEFDPVATGGMGIAARGQCTITMQGLSRSSGKNVYYCLLNTDEAAAQTTLGVDTDTGWLNGDEIAIASTSRTAAESEARTLNADAGASSLSVSSGLTNAHGGTAPVSAEVILLTRNVIVRSADSAKMTYFQIGLGNTTGADVVTIDIDWVRFRYCGSGASTVKAAIGTSLLAAGSSGLDVQYCSFDGGTGTQLWHNGTSSISTHVFSNNALWLGASTLTTAQQCIDLAAGAYTFSGNVVVGANTGGRMIFRTVACTFSNNRVAGLSGANGLWWTTTQDAAIGTISGNVQHSCAGVVTFTGGVGTVSGLTVWRCAGGNGNLIISLAGDLVFENLLMFGNASTQLAVTTDNVNLTLKSPVIAGDSSFASTYGILCSSIQIKQLRVIDGQFGVASGIYVAHTAGDIALNNTAVSPNIVLHNTVLGSTVEAFQMTQPLLDYRAGSQKHDGVAGAHKAWSKYGIISTDTTAGLYRTSSPSERLAPNNASSKLKSAVKRFAVASGGTATVSVYVRESIAGDGTDYDGARGRLILKANPAAGIASDTVLATATVASEGAFELLSGTTAAVTDDAVLEVYVDCDGTTGWVNVDDWSVA